MEFVLKDLIAVSKDGEWGKGEPFDHSVEMLAIRGTGRCLKMSVMRGVVRI